MPPPHLARLLTFLAVFVGVATLPSSASARYIVIPASFHHEVVIYGEQNMSCAAVSFVRWTPPSYATYGSGLATVSYEGVAPYDERTAYASPPGYHDDYAFGDSHFQAPAPGSHQAVISQSWSIGDPTNCGEMLAKQTGWLSNPRAEIWVEDQPRADFTAKEKTYEAGAFDFDATSVSPVGRMLSHDWDFGDGTTSKVDSLVHRYEKPGQYRVKLKATDTEAELSDTEERTIYVAAPSLSASILWDEDLEVAGRLPLNEPVDVTVRVRASRGAGDLKNLTFASNKVLQVLDGADLVEFEAQDAPAPFTLAPDEYRDFRAKIVPRQLGELRVETGITGEDAAGSGVSDFPSRYVKLGQDVEVKVTPDPDSLELDYDDDTGEVISKPVKVGISIRNLTGQTIDNAKLDVTAIVKTQVSRDPSKPRPLTFLTYTDRNGDRAPVAVSAAGQIVRDLELGDLQPDESVEVSLGSEAQDKARVRVTGIVRGVVDDGDGGRREAAGSGRADVRIGQPTLLRVLADTSAVTQQQAGSVWSLSSTIENVSPSEKVTVRVLTHKIGNTIGDPLDDALAPTKNDLGLIKTLEPGERLLVGGKFSSDPDGGTRSVVDLLVDGWVVDEDTGENRELLVDEISVADQPNGEPATRRRVAIDTRNAAKGDWTASSVGWYFTDGFARGFGRWVDSTQEDLEGRALNVKHAATFMFYLPATVVKYSDPAELKQAVDEISADLATSYAALKQISYAQARAAVDAQIQGKLLPILESYETGDVETLASESGKLLGEAAPDLIIDAATSVIAAERLMAKSAKTVLDKADSAQEATKASRVAAKGIRGFEPGDRLDFHDAEKFWGMDKDLHEKLLNYVKDKGIVVSMRERSPGSIKRLTEGALGKIEKIKAKNVNRVDVDYLGFAEDHLDYAMFKQMSPWKVVEQRVLAANSGLSFWERRELMAKVKSRWSSRAQEFVKESAEMAEAAATGKIKVPSKQWGLNPTGNFDPSVKFEGVWQKRKFKLAKAGDDVAATTDGLPAFQPQVYGETLVNGKLEKGLKPLTGDMDLIAIVDKNGKLLSDEDRIQIYRDLGKMGFQHPESLTWNDKAGRRKYLGDFDIANSKTGQALLAYLPDGTLGAIKLDSRKWWVELTENSAKGFALLQGKRMSWGEPDPVIPQQETSEVLPELGSIPPEDGNGRQAYDGPPTGDGDGADFDSGADSPLVRPNLDGSTSQWDPDTGRWLPTVTPPTGTPVKTVPQTALTDWTEPGDSRLPIIEQGELGLAPTGGEDWFEPGDRVVVDPGGKNQEVVTVAALGSIITAVPTTRPHRAGEMVAVVPKVRPVVVDPGTPAGPSDPGTPVGPTPPVSSSDPGTPAVPPANAGDAGQSAAPNPPVPAPGPGGPTPPAGGGTSSTLGSRPTLVRPSGVKTPKIKGTVRVGRRVTCTAGIWTGTAPLAYTYGWETGSGKRWKALKGKRTSKLTVPATASRRPLRCTVTATNGAGSASRASAPKVVAAKRR